MGQWNQWGRQGQWGGGGGSTPPAPTYSISGTVTDWEGAALSGVLLTLTGGYTATTDGTGAYTIANVPAGSYTLTPTKTGVTFNPVSAAVTVSTANVTGEDFQEQVWVVDGTITDWAGANLSGVLVSVTGDKTSSDTTVANGTYGLALPDGSYTLTPTKAGVTFNPASTAVVVSGASQLGKDFAEQVYAVSGNVVDAAAAAISGVTITITGDKSTSTSTDGSGDYSINLPNGSYTVTPTKAGYDFTPASTAVTVAGSAQTGKDFAEATYSISGDIVDGADAGVEGVLVTLSGDASDTDTTDSNGAYSFTGLPNGSYTVTPTLTDYIFAETHEDVTVAGDDVVVDDMVSSVAPPATGWTYLSGSGSLDTAYGPSEGYRLIGESNGLLPGMRENKTPAVTNGFTPRSLSGLEGTVAVGARCVNYPIYQGACYTAWTGAGLALDTVNGFRVMVALHPPQSWDGYFFVHNYSSGFGMVGNTTQNPLGTRVYIYAASNGGFPGYDDRVRAGSAVNSDPGVWGFDQAQLASESRNTWVFLGLEYPAGGDGNITARFVAPGVAGTVWPYSRSWVCPDLDSPVFDAISFRIKPNETNKYLYYGGHWYGSLADDWPV